jgi:hypothetical protein
MYPNPTSSNFTIEAQDLITNVSIFNLLGQEVISNNPNNQQANVDISTLSNGIYVVKATVNGIVSTSRIVKE